MVLALRETRREESERVRRERRISSAIWGPTPDVATDKKGRPKPCPPPCAFTRSGSHWLRFVEGSRESGHTLGMLAWNTDKGISQDAHYLAGLCSEFSPAVLALQEIRSVESIPDGYVIPPSLLQAAREAHSAPLLGEEGHIR